MSKASSYSPTRRSYIIPMVIIGSLFFIFGFITWVNGTLVTYLKIACELESDLQAYLVLFAFFIAYAVMAIPSSYVLRRTGYKKGMSLGLAIMAVGAFLFVPAANTRSFDFFLFGLFVIGTGLALLQTASNPYVSIIGPIESAAARISIMGICNKVAGILAGLIFGYITLSDADVLVANLTTISGEARAAALDELASRVVVPYIIIALTLVLLAVAILFSSLPEIEEEDSGINVSEETSEKTSILQFPHLLLGVLALFLYVGVEVIAGDTIINYGIYHGIEFNIARYFSQATLAYMLIGYIVGIIVIPNYISQSMALRVCGILGVVFAVLAIVTSGYVSVGFIAALGLANSLMWPAIFPLAINKLGRFTKIGSALLIMGITGGAVLPLLYGQLSDMTDPQLAYWILVPGYLFITYYAMVGHKAGLRARS